MPHDLLEATWYWTDFPANDCADVRPGSSGSPVLDLATGHLVGLVNTGTDGSEGRSDCMLDRPCEVGPDGVRSLDGAVYGPSLAGVAGCFDAGWRFVGPGGDCPLDPGVGLEVEGATDVTNPDRSTAGGRPGPTTWGARLRAPDGRPWWYRAKTGRLGRVDCHDVAGYGPVVALREQPVIDTPLPRAEGRYQLCLLAGPTPVPDVSWQAPWFATVVTAWVDRTPPIVPLGLEVVAEAGGWRVAPGIAPPELVWVRWKTGPAASTRCTDLEGYAVWRHAPRTLPASGRPWRVCAIGHGPAGNPTPVLDRVLD